MKALLAVATLVTVAGAASLSQEDMEFYAWKLKFGKSYSSAEEESRRKTTWMESRKLVQEHNLLADQGLKSFRHGMNQFADIDDQEYQDMFSGCLRSFNTSENHSATPLFQPEGGAALPKNVDWRKRGYVTAVKSQKNCGSCWAFSVTGALEGQVFRKKKKLISLSEQQLVDCSFKFGNTGCKGGWPTKAFKYIKSIGGLQSESSYPYKGKVGKCRFNKKKVVATCRGYKSVANGNERHLQKAVASVGPISVAIDADRPTFKLYKSGVYDDPKCSKSNLGHAVLVVGYGRAKKDYWLVKNSWSVKWGDKGYIKMSRNKKNQCGIASEALYPIV